MYKKTLPLLLIAVFLMFLVSCTEETTTSAETTTQTTILSTTQTTTETTIQTTTATLIQLPDLSGYSKSNIRNELDNLGIN